MVMEAVKGSAHQNQWPLLPATRIVSKAAPGSLAVQQSVLPHTQLEASDRMIGSLWDSAKHALKKYSLSDTSNRHLGWDSAAHFMLSSLRMPAQGMRLAFCQQLSTGSIRLAASLLPLIPNHISAAKLGSTLSIGTKQQSLDRLHIRSSRHELHSPLLCSSARHSVAQHSIAQHSTA